MADFFDFIKKPVSNTSGNGVAPPNLKINGNSSVSNNNLPASADGQKKPDDKTAPQPVTSHQQPNTNLDLMTHLTQRSNRVMMSAQTKTKELKADFVDSEHLLFGLTTDSEIYNLLVELKIQPQVIQDELNKIYKRGTVDRPVQVSPRIKRIVDNALVIARKLGFEFIAPEHLFLALYEEGEGAGARILAKLGVQKEDLNKKITGKKEGLTEEEKQAEKKKKALEQFTIDLTAKATQGLLDPVVERSQVIERVIHILSRRTKNNPSLVGEAGVGKTAIVEGLAEKIVAKEVPEPLLNKRILQLDLMSILAGASHRGEFEERMKDLIEQVKGSQGQIILFIDEIHNIVGAGASGEGSLDASNFLKPALARGEIQLIGATTLTEYRKYIEKDPALERRFQPVLVPEPTEEQGIKMLMAIKDKYEAFHRVKIPQDVIESAVRLSKRYVGDRFLPDKAVDLIDEAASAVRLPLISLPEEIKSLDTRIKELSQEMMESDKKGDKVKSRILKSKIAEIQDELKIKQEEYNLKKGQTTTSVTPDIIKDIISRWTGIPVAKITSSEVERLAHLEEIIHKRLINQETAVASVAQAVRRGRAGLKSATRPIGSFVFLGPTGVGKTELAKTLADVLFGSEDLMIRFDMTEYMEKHEVAKLLGAPPGYVGYEEGGKLTEQVRRKPYSVVLFDEIEKAHPDIFNILLQILDDGRLTDNKGHVISFKNTVVICTSNIGTKMIQEEMMKKADKQKSKTDFQPIREKVMTELLKFFKPELVNRFDEVTVFEPLNFQNMAEIVKLQLKAVGKLLEDQEMDFFYQDEVVEEIVQTGFDPLYGARPLKRAIQKLIENPISNLIIESKVKMGDVIRVRVEKGNLVFDIEKTQMVEKNFQKYNCKDCGNNFENEVVKNYTALCPKCGKKNVVKQNEKPATKPVS
ncbi:MAG: Negative regulator of genetic competence clpC/mecB [Candidatus Roizmanbacteria bacterium GW2011_GWC2_37_13]|uniref:Negative regulator of genetic competence clpC/mecB n=1 Tax=Candidatus Roizmanbacteria bacterium GW2011_GWC2_37_13 TaxID=1618486 RepID=A0A0G0IJR4_9BACT|nr:MAG: Negative regulator of genetic competence clpC/mecB [Candidatus Roizmanbacteria bacterium GW2011_GWC1_37_12]KKQ24454.1 MAG: Negative regulator of genetic competence clpC/mecB [Candidatus Roizmanbacteria bacterium GW2011_GWC2_37_13]